MSTCSVLSPHALSSWFSPTKPTATNHMLDLQIKCPPVIIDDNADRPGSFISGQLIIRPRESKLRIVALHVALHMVTTHKRPAQKNCDSCRKQSIELQKWKFIDEPITLSRGGQELPFFELLPSHLPPSASLPTLDISYHLRATALVQRPEDGHFVGSSVIIEHPVTFKQASSRATLPTYTSRVSSSTGIEFCTLLDSIQANQSNKVSIQINRLLSKSGSTNNLYGWKILRTEWALEEITHVSKGICDLHTQKSEDMEKETRTRRIAGNVLYQECKSTEESDGSSTTIDFPVDLTSKCPSSTLCSFDSPEYDILKVEHVLTIELMAIFEKLTGEDGEKPAAVGGGRLIKQRFPVVLVNSLEADDDDDKSGSDLPGYYEVASR